MSKPIIKKKFGLTIISTLILILVSSIVSIAQGINNLTMDKKYIRVDIGHGAMHCPFLSPKLEAKLREIQNVENFFIDKRNSYATFNLPSDTEMTSESLKKIGTDVGYPADDVVITIDIKPIKVITK
ncbi:MAG: hypothetical protein K8R85_02275 [Bacteroidetes bacterium]|nr:hypothetical protein [Bacteroidota bacterium]